MAMVVRFVVLVVGMFMSMQMLADEGAENNALYLERLTYEYDNRAYAYISMAKLAEKNAGSPIGEFYQGYYDLEVVNQAVYGAMQKPLGFEFEPGFSAKFNAYTSVFLASLLTVTPEFLVDFIDPYIADLEELRQLSNPKYRAFFDYVVAQELAQLEASKVAQQQGWAEGAKVFHRFIESTRSYTGAFQPKDL